MADDEARTIMFRNAEVRQRSLEENLIEAARAALMTYGESYGQMMTAVRNYKALWSQGRYCPPEALNRALLDAKDHIDHFCEVCIREDRVDYMHETLAIIGVQLPPGS